MRMTFLCVTWWASKSSCLKRARMAGLRRQFGTDQLKRYGPVQFPILALYTAPMPPSQQLKNLVAPSEHVSGLQLRSAHVPAVSAAW